MIIADIFHTDVVTLKVSESADYAAALQVFWCWRRQQGEKVSINDLTDEFVALNDSETATPDRWHPIDWLIRSAVGAASL